VNSLNNCNYIALKYLLFEIREQNMMFPPGRTELEKVASGGDILEDKFKLFMKIILENSSIFQNDKLTNLTEMEEISLKLIKNYIKRDGIRISSKTIQKLANTSECIGINFNDYVKFWKSIVLEFIEGCFEIS